MIKIIGDDIYLDSDKVGEITVGTSVNRDKLTEILNTEFNYTHTFTIQCPECFHEWEDTFYE